jgi:integrase/recombinase XerD
MYRSVLERTVLPWLEREGVRDVEAIDRRVLDRLSAELLESDGRDGPRSRATVASYLRVTNAWLAWCAKEGEGSGAKAQVPTVRKRVRDTLSRQEITVLETAAETERDRLLVRVLADTGMRLGELLSIRYGDLVHGDRGWSVRVSGKTGERLIPLNPHLGRRMRKQIDRQRARSDADVMFTTLRRSAKTGTIVPLTGRTVQITLKSLARITDIAPERVHPHAFRHSLTTELLRKGVNPIKVAELLGHRSLTMLMSNYSHVRADDVREDLERLLVE